MTDDISERAFEEAIEAALLRHGPDDPHTALEVGDRVPRHPSGGYRKRDSKDYDAELCLLPQDVVDFLIATQPQEWERLRQHYGAEVGSRFTVRLSREVARRGALDVLRNGVKDMGCHFQLAYFPPATQLNEEAARLHAGNLFAVARQVHYSAKDAGNSLDMVLFLNGLPLFTVELKSPLNGQRVEDAVAQYKKTRDPREALFGYGRCLAHFAVDPSMVYFATHLEGEKTRFLPFNQGWNRGAGNPPVPPSRSGYATAYLWEGTWRKDSILELVRRFVHEVQDEDERGRRTGKRFAIFPRFHQLECVQRLIADAREKGPGQQYLIQHSAGSGKSFTIAWLAHQLSTLHRGDARVFDSIVVISDRRVIDRQLQSAIRQFEQTLGVVENIDDTSRQLKEALESGKTIIVTTLQKFPVIVDQIGTLPGRNFALVVDEAHSSQTGESSKSVKEVLGSLEEAERTEANTETPDEELERTVLAEMEKRGRRPNISIFAFTATPKAKTLELFGTKKDDGTFAPFHLYSMRQAIEEGFICDVLASYTTYRAYWELLKKVESDPRYDKRKANALLKSFVELHPHAIDAKVQVMVDHFANQAASEIGGKAKAMIVTRSRLHAVRYKLALDAHLAKAGLRYKTLAAFSGTVQDGGKSYTEAGMNGVSELQTAKTFAMPDYRFLVVANKFQTGFDQPLLHTMYVDKKLGGVNAVQTLSRLNRVHPEKDGTMVLDFANDADEIREAFEPYYETTLLSEATDPNLLYELQARLESVPVYTNADVEAFAKAFFKRTVRLDRLHAALSPAIERFNELHDDDKRRFRGWLTDYIRLYAFLSQVLPFEDAGLEKLYAFARHLRRLLIIDGETLPREVQQNIDMESYQTRQTGSGEVNLSRRAGWVDPMTSAPTQEPVEEELEPLSRIIAELNKRFGIELGECGHATLAQVARKLEDDTALDAAAKVNTRDNVRESFDHKVNDLLQEVVDSNFDLYKRYTDEPSFGDALRGHLFDLYLRSHRNAAELAKQGESATLEFKSSLRWNLREDRKDDKRITHAALKTIAAFLNTDGGDLLIGVADDGTALGIDHDNLETDDKFMRHLAQVVRNGLGPRASTCVDPKMQTVNGKRVCLVSCRRSPEPVRLKWKGLEAAPDGDFFVRSGPGTVALTEDDAREYTRTRFSAVSR